MTYQLIYKPLIQTAHKLIVTLIQTFHEARETSAVSYQLRQAIRPVQNFQQIIGRVNRNLYCISKCENFVTSLLYINDDELFHKEKSIIYHLV